MINKKIDFNLFFEKCESVSYAVIKLSPDFPSYVIGADLDIFCRDIEEMSRLVVSFFSGYVQDGVYVRALKKDNRVHVDLIENESIHFRFDLVDKMPNYKNILVKPSLFDVVIENSILKELDDFVVKVPSIEDDCVLRYLEYVEYYERVPDKIKHAEYINSLIESTVLDKKLFFERVRYYTRLPDVKYHKKSFMDKLVEQYKYIVVRTGQAKQLLTERGLKALVLKVYSKIK